jgi:uncharacterized protein (TIGR02246 family)
MQRIFSMTALAFCLALAGLANAEDESSPLQAVRQFYDAFNAHRFDDVSAFTTVDWNHINPGGGRTSGREAVLRELREVHATFLKAVTDRIERIDSRSVGADVMIVTVNSRMSTFTMPDGVVHPNEAHVRTFVLVRRGARWLITQDQNTTVDERGR